MKKLPIIKIKPQVSLGEFIIFWSKQYHYPKDVYDKIIAKKQFDKKDIEEIYKWKNGSELSKSKQNSLKNKITKKIVVVNKLKQQANFSIEEFKKHFSDVSFVWKIFLLHIINPKKFPIYDQHIHRAYNFIHGLNWKDINHAINEKKKSEFYFDVYLKFIHKNKINDIQKLDESFFAFGQFINTKKYATLLTQ